MDKRGTGSAIDGAGQEQRRAAFATLIKQYEPAVLRAARRMCGGNEDEAQDLVQDTVIKAYSAYVGGRFQAGTNTRAWMLRILTNGFINTYNRKQRWEDPAGLDGLTQEGSVLPEVLRASRADQPEAVLLASTFEEPVERAIASLSPELRVCIELVDIGELDYAEAAETLQIPIGTVRSRLFRGRQQLHRALHHYAEQRGLTGGSVG